MNYVAVLPVATPTKTTNKVIYFISILRIAAFSLALVL